MKLREFLNLIFRSSVDIHIGVYNGKHNGGDVYTTLVIEKNREGSFGDIKHPDIAPYLDCEAGLLTMEESSCSIVLDTGLELLPSTFNKKRITVVIPRYNDLEDFINNHPTSIFIIYRYDLPEFKVEILSPEGDTSTHFNSGLSYIRRIEQIGNDCYAIIILKWGDVSWGDTSTCD